MSRSTIIALSHRTMEQPWGACEETPELFSKARLFPPGPTFVGKGNRGIARSLLELDFEFTCPSDRKPFASLENKNEAKPTCRSQRPTATLYTVRSEMRGGWERSQEALLRASVQPTKSETRLFERVGFPGSPGLSASKKVSSLVSRYCGSNSGFDVSTMALAHKIQPRSRFGAG